MARIITRVFQADKDGIRFCLVDAVTPAVSHASIAETRFVCPRAGSDGVRRLADPADWLGFWPYGYGEGGGNHRVRRGDAKGGEVRPAPPLKRLELQPHRTLAENLADLPTRCDVGCKRNSQGYQESWIGYKLHLDTMDGDLPASALLTSASVHDSQPAIPLAQLTAQRVTSLYDLMDSAYDAPQIHAFSRSLGHVPIIDPNPRGGEKRPFAPAEAQRFKERSASERVNSLLKERYGGRWVRVRGAAQGDVPPDVRVGGVDRDGAVCAALLKAMNRAARSWRSGRRAENQTRTAERHCHR